MYGTLIVDNSASDAVSFTLVWRDWLTPGFRPLTDGEAADRRARAAAFISQQSGLSAAQRPAMTAKLGAVAELVASPDHLDEALDLALIHYRLPAAEAQVREDFIHRCLAAEFSDVIHESPDDWAPLQQLLNKLALQALLVPQPLIGHCIRQACYDLRREMMGATSIYLDFLPACYSKPHAWLTAVYDSSYRSALIPLANVLWTRRADERQAVFDILVPWAEKVGLDVVGRAADYATKTGFNKDKILFGDFLASVILDLDTATGQPALPWDVHWGLVQHGHRTAIEAAVWEALSFAPHDELAPLGEWHDLERLPISAQPQVAPSLTLSSQSIAETGDAYAGRCQVKTMAWLDGPIAANQAPPVSVVDIVNRELPGNASDLPPLNRKAKGKKPTDNAKAAREKAQEVQRTMAVALRSTAEFLLGEVSDGLREAKSAAVAGATVKQAEQCQKSLNDSLAAEIVLTAVAPIRQRLHDAERAIEALRTAIAAKRASETQERTLQRFLACLCQALHGEPLVAGKRSGGVIPFEASASDRDWIAQRVHRRCLLTASRIFVGGQSVALGRDRALGLYVTLSSRSSTHYVFDVSVHLWRRRAGGSLPPMKASLAADPFPPFNEEEWTDTLLPCTVLHVPRKG